ncbi:MAG: transporter [Desulforegulaceae bacterium]|jgi:hypothetical protein|nr:transporter [Desulforegulaceae bacterium]
MMKIKELKKYVLVFLLIFAAFIPKSFSEQNLNEEAEQKILELEQRVEELKTKEEPFEKEKKDKIIKEDDYIKLLTAAGREYSLRAPGVIGVDYTFSYYGKSYDNISAAEESGTAFEREATHRIINTVSVEYPLKNNLSFVMDLPFVSVYDDAQGQKSDMDDFGDPYMGILFQPFKEKPGKPSLIVSSGFTFPMGRSPYEINPQTEYPTGEGVFTYNLSLGLSKKLSPSLVYGSIFYSYKFKDNDTSFKNNLYLGEAGEWLKKVKPGDETGFDAGMGYVISEKVSISMGCRFVYQFPTNYYWRGRGKLSSSSTISSLALLGTAWQVTEKRKIYMELGIGLTNNDEDLNFKLRIPFNFIL